MTIEQTLQKYYMDMLVKYRIDFLRIPNQANKGRTASYKSYGIWVDGENCTKYAPDVIFFFNGSVYCREFGEKNSNSNRKKKQAERLHHWKEQAGVDGLIVYDLDMAKKDWQVILGSKYLEIT